MRKYSLMFFILIAFMLVFANVSAKPEDLRVVPVSEYQYHNVDGYGFYEKCADQSWFGMAFSNEGEQAVDVTFPEKVRITGWDGTIHTTNNFRYREFDLNRVNFHNFELTGTSFQKTLSIPAHGVYAVFFDILGISNYNLYWDTNVFFSITISSEGKSTSRDVTGVLAQRGNACSAEQVCTAEVLSGSFASNGEGSVSVHIRNNMPDTAYVYARPEVDISWTDSNGKTQTQTVDNAVRWASQPEWMGSQTETSISGTFTLPTEIASVQQKLMMTFHFYHPSSLFFGWFSAQKELALQSGLQGVISGSYGTNGKNGIFRVVLNNFQSQDVSVNLPAEGKLSDGSEQNTIALLEWDQMGPVKIAANGSADLSGSFTFADRGIIHANSSLILSMNFTGDTGSGTAAGIITRNPDPNPVIKSVSFCRDIEGNILTFAYVLKNESNIDIPVDLATTLAVSGETRNPSIRYTDCQRSGKSCFAGSDVYNYTIGAGETMTFSGEASLNTTPSGSRIVAETSLLYYPDGEKTALYVGTAADSCKTAPTQATETFGQTATPTAEIPVPSTPTAVPSATAVNPPISTSTPVGRPTTTPEADITPETGTAHLRALISSGSYNKCDNDTSLHFTMKIVNHGTASETVNLSDIDFQLDGNKIRVNFISCAEMSAAGTDNIRCLTGLSGQSITVRPGTTLSLDGIYQPSAAIEGESVTISASSPHFEPQRTELLVRQNSDGCGPHITVLRDSKGNDVLASLSRTKDSIRLSIQFMNSGNGDAVIRPGTIYFHQTALSDYQAVLEIEAMQAAMSGKAAELITQGSTFILPARSVATLSVDLGVNLAEAYAGSVNISWNFNIDNQSVNYTGTLNFAQNRPSPVNRIVNPTGNAPLHFYAIGEPILPQILPATGFSTKGSGQTAAIQPENLSYKKLDGLHLEIPVINTKADLVRIPLNENREWAVDWLREDAGVLSSGALPGKGTSVIAAHNHLDEMNIGPFLWLFELKNNDRVFVTDDDGNVLAFKVYANELLNPEDSSLIYQKAIPGSLVLLTCEDEMPEGGYAYRRAVFAEPLQ